MKAVIFDYGEVLCTQDHDAHRRLLALTGLDHATFEGLYWRDRRDYDLGLLDGRGYWSKFGRDAGLSFTTDQIDLLIENDVLMWVKVNEAMLAWVAALRSAGLRIAILSNMGPEVLRYMRQEFAWLAPFDQLTWSCELRLAKPDPAIYIHTCEKLGVRPEEALFLDDKIENVRAAEQLGLVAIQFKNIEQLRRDLAARNLLQDVPLPAA
ncbi:MAG TPA: HAD family phosphatase [Acidobacteriaceae bacterium]|jgi:putative hydrolase of the HAD superfamily|nr:HAD family phosphatase [Acidobacteriaceae bacterium]